jgi:hypothetical protein
MISQPDPAIINSQKVPFIILFMGVIGALGVGLAMVEYFIEFNPLLILVGGAIFIGANLFFVLNFASRKTRSDIVGDFHSHNLISWMIAAVLTVAIALFFGLGMIAWGYLNGVGTKITLAGTLQSLAMMFSCFIVYGWVAWYSEVIKRKNN